MWHQIEDHDVIADRFRRVVSQGRLASTYLFLGPAGIGKRMFAQQLAQALLCEESLEDPLDYCGACSSCRLATAGNHPDLMVIGLPKDKNTLPISLFVGEGERRHKEGLCHHLSLKPYMGQRRVAIIDDADFLSAESANCLLKTLEEPPPRSLLILIGTSPNRQLPTIRSRAQLTHFRPLQPATVERLLVSKGLIEDSRQAASLAEFSAGSLKRAVELADPQLWQFRRNLIEWLAATPLDVVAMARNVLEFVEAAGKDALARRTRLRSIMNFAAEYYRERMRSLGTDSLVEKLDHCLVALENVDRYANQASLVHWWAAGLDNSPARS